MPVILGKSFWQPLEVSGCDEPCDVRVDRPTATLLLKYRKEETLIVKRKVVPNRDAANLKFVPNLIMEFRKGHWIDESSGTQEDLAELPIEEARKRLLRLCPTAIDMLGDILFHASEGNEEPEADGAVDPDAFNPEDEESDGGITLPNSEKRSEE